jgi:hypothetical protein
MHKKSHVRKNAKFRGFLGAFIKSKWFISMNSFKKKLLASIVKFLDFSLLS